MPFKNSYFCSIFRSSTSSNKSNYPKLKGHFSQASQVPFAFDRSKPTGHRIDPQLIQLGDEYLKMETTYKVCIKRLSKRKQEQLQQMQDDWKADDSGGNMDKILDIEDRSVQNITQHIGGEDNPVTESYTEDSD
uniref:Uncharacterized protein n=1 Tax=Glossina austeni TaxID=7395 RepID=A0A1A9UKW7_GLOAU